MTSLTDVYEGDAGRVATRRQRLVGTGLFLCGAAALVGAIAVATTTVGNAALGRVAARELAGVLGGLGLPAVVLGAFAVQPANGRTRAAAIIGTGVAVLGVALFTAVYPQSWVDTAPLVALGTMVVYAAGVGTTFWCLFLALATFDPRAAPGGTARMEVTEEGRIRLVENASIPGFGSVGLFGRGPDGDVATQTNRADDPPVSEATDGDGSELLAGGPVEREQESNAADPGTTATPAPTADGGSAAVAGPKEHTDAEFLTAADERGRPDAYCGNCAHFEYVLSEGDITPYCARHDELMDDMDACEAWTETDRAGR
ncbi:MAG: hypothetical protein ABEJ89_07600 [Haloarculaceae archaeon]